jgi:hypothetical protein
MVAAREKGSRLKVGENRGWWQLDRVVAGGWVMLIGRKCEARHG